MAQGHGEKLSRRREKAIAELLRQRTFTGAAEAAGVAPRTLRRWLRDVEFVTALRAARWQLVELAIGEVQSAATSAVAVLRRKMRKAGRDADQIRAALGIYDRAVSGVQLTDIVQRLEAVEERLAAKAAPPPVGIGSRNGSFTHPR